MVSRVGAAPAPSADALAFGDFLMSQQRYREAEVEFERYAFAHPQDAQAAAAVERLLNAGLRTENWSFCLALAREWAARTDGASRCAAQWTESLALYHLENYPAVVRAMPAPECSQDWQARARYLQGLSLLWEKDWTGASAQFKNVPPDSSLFAQASHAAHESLTGPRLHLKSPTGAALLSAVLPGAGYAYADRPQTAVAAFAVNALFLGGTYSAVHAGQPGVAGVVALFELGWYMGAVYGSAQAADHENHRRLASLINPLEIHW